MTIQNIEDVMDRIMSLNRNLTEESLRTLLSASGWDKDDIVEGIRLFKLRTMSSHSFTAAPVIPSVSTLKVQPVEDYSFNIKKEEPKIDIPPVPTPVVEDKKPNIPEPPKTEGPALPLIEDKPKKSFPAKIFSLVLILILLGLVVVYLFPGAFGNLIDKIFVRHNNAPIQTQDIAQSSSSINDPASSSAMINSSTSLETLLKEIANLRDEFNSYKQSNQSSQTIVKYISQRGATGKAGRGISSVSATSTGFIINYTDNTSTIIPYSTTTIINILNSNSVCFREVTSTSTETVNDICLNRDMVSKLIASSTVSR